VCASVWPPSSHVYPFATWRPKVRTVAGREANRRGPAVPSPPSLSFINTTARSSSSSSHSPPSRTELHAFAPPPFSVRRRSFKLRRPANSRRASAGLRCAEFFGSNFLASAAFVLLRELLRLAVDGARRRPQTRFTASERFPQRPRRSRLVPISLYSPFACFPDLEPLVFLFALFLWFYSYS
jgi:hypothetical protein